MLAADWDIFEELGLLRSHSTAAFLIHECVCGEEHDRLVDGGRQLNEWTQLDTNRKART